MNKFNDFNVDCFVIFVTYQRKNKTNSIFRVNLTKKKDTKFCVLAIIFTQFSLYNYPPVRHFNNSIRGFGEIIIVRYGDYGLVKFGS